jgi:hypothetical protein
MLDCSLNLLCRKNFKYVPHILLVKVMLKFCSNVLKLASDFVTSC